MDARRQTARGGVALRGISRRFGAVAALGGVDLDVAPGEVHALLGENGAGKTTLLSVLSGLVQPDAGSISIDGSPVTLASPADALRHGIGTVHQHLTLVPTLTVRENLLLGDEGGFRVRRPAFGVRRERAARGWLGTGGAEDVGLGLPLDAVVGGLAIGVRQRVEIAKALRRGTRALLLDEPTATLAPAEVDDLLAMLRRLAAAGWAVVLVTHKLDEALAASDRVTVLRAGRGVLSEAVGADREALRGRIVGAMFASVGGGREEGGEGTERRIGGASNGGSDDRTAAPSPSQAPQRALGGWGGGESRGHGETGGSDQHDEHVVGPSTSPQPPRWSSLPTSARGFNPYVGRLDPGVPPRGGRTLDDHQAGVATGGRPLLQVDRLSARDDRGASALDGVSLEVRAGEILGIAGVEGNGQRELAEVLAGQRRPTGGAVRLDGEDVTALGVAGRLEAGIAFLTDERLGEGIVPGASVALNLALKRLNRPPFAVGLRLDRRAIRHRAVGTIAEHGIRPANPDRDVAALSGGNIQRALVARELAGNPRLLIASKPTAGLDLRTAERVLGLLRGHAETGAAVLLISNELDELLATADRVAVLYRGGVAGIVERSPSEGTASEREPFDRASPDRGSFDRAAIGRLMLTGAA